MGGGRLVLSVEQGLVDVGPELFDVEQGVVKDDVGGPALAGLGPGVVLAGVVEVGDAGRGASTDDLAQVNGFAAVIAAGDGGAADGVDGAFDEATAAERVVAAVLVRKGRDDGLNEEVLVCLVSEGVPEVAGVTGGALVECGVGAGGLRDAGLRSSEDERGVVEAVLQAGDELVLGSLRA